jgi:hypothetical protein
VLQHLFSVRKNLRKTQTTRCRRYSLLGMLEVDEFMAATSRAGRISSLLALCPNYFLAQTVGASGQGAHWATGASDWTTMGRLTTDALVPAPLALVAESRLFTLLLFEPITAEIPRSAPLQMAAVSSGPAALLPPLGSGSESMWASGRSCMPTTLGAGSRPWPRAHEDRTTVAGRKGERGKWFATRFVRACPKGHVDDLDWHAHGPEDKCRRPDGPTPGEENDPIIRRGNGERASKGRAPPACP